MIARRSPSRNPIIRIHTPEQIRILAILTIAVVLILCAWMMNIPPWAARGMTAVGLTLSVVTGLVAFRTHRKAEARRMVTGLLKGFIEKDASPCFITDTDGGIHAFNPMALSRFEHSIADTLAATLRSILANPSAVLFRLQSKAQNEGAASEDVVTRRGHVRLSVHEMTLGNYLWRIEDVVERIAPTRPAEIVSIPMIQIGRNGAVLFMNEASRTLIGGRVKTLKQLFPAGPARDGQMSTLVSKTGPVDVIVSAHNRDQGRSELYFLPSKPISSGPQTGFDTLPVPMLRLNPEGQILAVNLMCMNLLGLEDYKETHLGQLMEGLGRPMSDWFKETALGLAPHKSEFLRLSRKDKEVFVQVTLTRVVQDEGTTLIAVLNDATELKTLEAQFVQSQKMQAIGQLAGGVAHDFNNLLTAISGHCDLLLLRHDQRDQDYGDLIQIHENANRAAALVSQLLAFSRKQTLLPETLDIRDTLSDLTHLLNRLVGERVTLTLSHDPLIRAIRADKRQLEQVLMNLVVNARDAMPQGGEIRIETETLTLDAPLERNRAVIPPGEWVTIKVSDEGVGIPPDRLQKVFEPFYTTKRTGEGTGLGLSTAYGIIKQTGGYIFVDSVQNRGTTFTLFFPVHKHVAAVVEPAQSKIEANKAATAKHGEGVILLVEDEAPVRAFASRALRMRGYTVLEAESAEDALDVLSDKALDVDVFVTDVVMPGMDGPSWVREALKERPGTRVVFVSGYSEGAFNESEEPVPNSVFLPKPFSLSELTETVQQQLSADTDA